MGFQLAVLPERVIAGICKSDAFTKQLVDRLDAMTSLTLRQAFLSLSVSLSSLAISTAANASDDALPAFVSQIDARVIAVISDGDFRASSYRDGKLPPAATDRVDALTLIQNGARPIRVSLPVSNSVTAPPEVMAISPDGRFAYVVERLGQRSDTRLRASDLSPGRRLTAIDIHDPAKPTISASVDAGPMIESVRVSPDGRHLALTANSEDDALIQIVPTRNGALGAVQSFRISELGVARRDGLARGGIAVTMADWHPSGRYLSINLNTRNQVLFAALEERSGDGTLRLSPWGPPVDVGVDPFVGRFTPDGGHYVSADWGRDFNATGLEGRLPSRPSRITLIRLASREPIGTGTRHTVITSVESDRSSEGLAISKDGRSIATVNMRETAFATDSPRFTRDASISYFRFDAARSAIEKIGDYPFRGVLPEGGSFDATGKHFMATVFEYADSASPAAGLEVWRVGSADLPGLTYVGRIPMPAGAHHVEIAP